VKTVGLTVMAFFSMAVFFTVQAFAYLDPSAMTYVTQVVAGVLIASGAFFIIYWRKIKLFFKKKKEKKNAGHKEK